MRRRCGKHVSLWSVQALAPILFGGIQYLKGMPGKSWSGVLPPLTLQQARLADRLRKHIAVLSEEIGERNLWRDGTLAATANHVEATLQTPGYAVSSQAFTVQGTGVRNLEAVLEGTSLAEKSF